MSVSSIPAAKRRFDMGLFCIFLFYILYVNYITKDKIVNDEIPFVFMRIYDYAQYFVLCERIIVQKHFLSRLLCIITHFVSRCCRIHFFVELALNKFFVCPNCYYSGFVRGGGCGARCLLDFVDDARDDKEEESIGSKAIV